MTTPGRILVADDDETFRSATADLFRCEGYHCDEAPDAPTAVQLATTAAYDVLVADIMMPGNSDFELVRALPQIHKGLPVVIVTAYPSIETAVQSIQSPVMAYLIKPVDFPELLNRVKAAVRSGRVYRGMRSVGQRLEQWYGDLEQVKDLAQRPPDDASSVSVDAFVSLTLRNILASLMDMKEVAELTVGGQPKAGTCHMLDCPRLGKVRAALKDAVAVLERTKGAFKSKELGQLRADLQRLITEIGD